MTGRQARARLRWLGLTTIMAIGGAGVALGAALDQASLEYGGSTIRDIFRYPGQALQDYWYYLVGGLVLLLFLWTYVRK